MTVIGTTGRDQKLRETGIEPLPHAAPQRIGAHRHHAVDVTCGSACRGSVPAFRKPIGGVEEIGSVVLGIHDPARVGLVHRHPQRSRLLGRDEPRHPAVAEATTPQRTGHLTRQVHGPAAASVRSPRHRGDTWGRIHGLTCPEAPQQAPTAAARSARSMPWAPLSASSGRRSTPRSSNRRPQPVELGELTGERDRMATRQDEVRTQLQPLGAGRRAPPAPPSGRAWPVGGIGHPDRVEPRRSRSSISAG